MRLRRLLLSIIASGLLALILYGMPRFSSAATNGPTYSLTDVRASMGINSPMENGTYLGSLVTLNAGASFQVYAVTSDIRRIPVEDIELLYNLDDDEWKAIPLISVKN